MTFETFMESNLKNYEDHLSNEDKSKLLVAFSALNSARVIEEKYIIAKLYSNASTEQAMDAGYLRVRMQQDLDQMVHDVKQDAFSLVRKKK